MYVRPLTRTTSLRMSLTNGTGTGLSCYSRPDERGCYFATRWVRLFFLPLFPVRRYYMTKGKLLGEASLDAGEVLRTYLFAWLFAPVFIVLPMALAKFTSGAWGWFFISIVLLALFSGLRRNWAPRYVARWGPPPVQEP